MIYRLGDICTITKGAIGIMKAVTGTYQMVTLAEERRSHADYQFDVPDGAVIVPLVSSTGHGHASLKRVHYQEGKFALGNILCAIIPKNYNQLLAKYLHIYLQDNKEEVLVPLMRGMANVSLPMGKIAAIELDVPSLERQREIIEIEAQISRSYAQLTRFFDDQEQLANQLQQAILQDAVQGMLTKAFREREGGVAQTGADLLAQIHAEEAELIKAKKLKKGKPMPPITDAEKPFDLPKEWAWSRLGDLGTFVGGGTPSKDNKSFWEGVIPWVSPKDMKTKFIIDSIDHISEKAVSESSAKLVPIDSVLVVVRGMILLKTIPIAINKVPVTLNQDMKALILHKMLSVPYLYLSLKGCETLLRKRINTATHGTGKLDSELLTKFLIPLPPLSEQQVVVVAVERTLGQVEQLRAELSSQRETAGALLKALLHRAFGGGDLVEVESD